jgi:hypothetical protein
VQPVAQQGCQPLAGESLAPLPALTDESHAGHAWRSLERQTDRDRFLMNSLRFI